MGDPLYPWDRKQESQQDEREAGLLPCPLCGFRAELRQNEVFQDRTDMATCVSCGCSAHVSKWNKRASQQVQADARAVKRYGWNIDDMTPQADGEWVNYSDIKHLIAAHPSPAAESDKRDAERYRMFRKHSDYWTKHGRQAVTLGMWEEDLDAAIDDAMSREQSGGQ